ncbi:MAG TPA: lipopolysaccharide kinase InaA family protein [Candidatus Acidoferrales bacterium]|nr:lipopolysaccharide kinase InaA family protein [Candidatus Acidoferrales bacterium]
MASYTKYKNYWDSGWSLWVWPEKWNDNLWSVICQQIESQLPSKHPQTNEIQLPGSTEVLFLKSFHRVSPAATLKDLFRLSKALRGLKMGALLDDLGFNVAAAIAAGERRRWGVLERSFLLTSAVAGSPMPVFLRERYGVKKADIPLRKKWHALRRLALEIRRLHELGFVHGDLVPSNILVGNVQDGEYPFFFLDHDRTRRYPKWFPQSLWKRNLVQLNRFPLAGISLQDRMRFFHSYLGREDCGKGDRRLVEWLEEKTRKRRRECDAVDVSGSFRKLMHWDDAAVQGSRFKA